MNNKHFCSFLLNPYTIFFLYNILLHWLEPPEWCGIKVKIMNIFVFLKGKSFSFWTFSRMFAIHFSLITFIGLKVFPSIPILLRILIWMFYISARFYQMLFLQLWKCSCDFSFNLCVYKINIYIKETSLWIS